MQQSPQWLLVNKNESVHSFLTLIDKVFIEFPKGIKTRESVAIFIHYLSKVLKLDASHIIAGEFKGKRHASNTLLPSDA